MNTNSLKYHLVEDPVTYNFTRHLRVRDHTTWFRRCLGTVAFEHFLIGLSQFHGHGSWLVCETPLNLVEELILLQSLQPWWMSLHIAHPHLLVRATNKRFLRARATFKSVLASESHWLQTNVGTHRLLVARTSNRGWANRRHEPQPKITVAWILPHKPVGRMLLLT